MVLRISAWTALAFGLALAVLEAARNWGDWQWWPFWVVDYIAAFLLIGGGLAVIRRGAAAARWLTGGWGFACAMFWMSFFSHLGDAMQTPPDARERTITAFIAAMFAITVLGFLASLLGGAGGGKRE